MRIDTYVIAAALALNVATAPPPAQAEEWQYDFFVYGLGASLDGEVGIGPVEIDVDVGFSDILDNLETGGMLAFRAKKGDWAVMADAIFVGLGAADDRLDVDVDELILEVDFAYRFTEIFEVLFGARFVDIDSRIDFLGPLGVTAEAGDSWIDPVVGLRFEAPLNDRWLFTGRADFSTGGGSDFASNVVLNLGRRLGERSTFVFGWRALDIDYEDGEGSDRFKYDTLTSGPLVGVAFHF